MNEPTAKSKIREVFESIKPFVIPGLPGTWVLREVKGFEGKHYDDNGNLVSETISVKFPDKTEF